MTDEGQTRLKAANPAVRRLEEAIEADFTPDEIATVKRWLVASAEELPKGTASNRTPGAGNKSPRADVGIEHETR